MTDELAASTSLSASMTTYTHHPKYIFIVPYRDRKQHRVFFSSYIPKIMEDVPAADWTYLFIHQTDNRPFNRGAMKNIGFLAIKYKYPNDYKNIILIFNDIDTLPYDKNVINYDTVAGTVKHYYGFRFALGGIFSITAGDFEKTNGFPNFWAWGGEDNLIYTRAKRIGLNVDRSTFFLIGDMNILQFADGLKRLICRDELATTLYSDNMDGITTIKNLNYKFLDDNEHMIDVSTFDTLISPSILHFEEQTIDRVGKIRVPTRSKNAIMSRMNDQIRSNMNNNNNTSSSSSSSLSYQQLAVPTPIQVRNITQPQLPFMSINNNFDKRLSFATAATNQMIFSTPDHQNNQSQNAVFTRRGNSAENIILPFATQSQQQSSSQAQPQPQTQSQQSQSQQSQSQYIMRRSGMRSLFMP